MPSSLLRPMGADALLPKRPHPAAPAKEPADPLAELQNLLAEFSVEEAEDFQEADFMPTEQMPVPAQQRAAKAVDRADLGAAAQRALAAQMAVGRVGRDGLGKLVHNAALQLAGRGTRKGDDKEAVDVLGIRAVGEIAHQRVADSIDDAGDGEDK